ncbi:beta-lactamase family protein [Bowmanella sp. Y26]|uniref:serine hydrolase domain-containing protein n=1 Tax=Bowmanella yangjiangensis TaxID=2811230 RepID=UPI001BDD0D22|nr:serine hydrolase [Bowmanella yangjiangensis]MBT1064214.1 beta-lactamase family protein [Bowmanella yangjiangensis]
MKLLIKVLLGVFTALSMQVGNAEVLDKETLQRIQRQLPKQIEKLYVDNGLRGDFLIAVVDTEGLRYAYSLNERGASPKDNGLTTSTPFLLASHTKAFTGTLAQLLQEQGRFSLNAPLRQYLADLILDKRVAVDEISIAQLLNHTAGFTSTQHSFKTAYLGYQDESELVTALNSKMLVAAPGKFRYSNTGPILAAAAMEKATGQSWQTLMREEIFIPLGMSNTSTDLSDYPPGAILSSIELDSEGKLARKGLYKLNTTLHAAGGAVSTLADMAKWLQFNLRQSQHLSDSAHFFDRLHQATTVQEKHYFTYQRSGYSLAWDIADYYDKPILTRFGSYAGISLHVSFLPTEKLAVVSVYNEERGFLLPHVAANYIYNLVVSPGAAQQRFDVEQARLHQSVEQENAKLLAYSRQVRVSPEWETWMGKYQANDGWPVMEIFEKQQVVWLRWGALDGPLYQSEDNQFTAALGSLRRDIRLATEHGKRMIKNGSIDYVRSP